MTSKNTADFPVIQTQRLYINALTLDDIPSFYAYRTHPDIVRYQGVFPRNEDDVKQLVEEQNRAPFGKVNQWFQFALRLLPQQTIIGDIGLQFNATFIPQVEIAYSIAPDYQRKGFARESVQALIEDLFINRNIKTISATIDVRNTASESLLKSLGFHRVAFRPHACYLRGEWCDEADFGLFSKI